MTKKLSEYTIKYRARSRRTSKNRRYYPPTESDFPIHGWFPYSNIHRERMRAHEKHADKPGGSMEMKAYDNPDWLPVLVEEIGEVAKVICDHRHGLLSDKEKKQQLNDELIQVAAMTAAWIDAINLDLRKLD